MRRSTAILAVLAIVATLAFLRLPHAEASSHREAPLIAQDPRTDGTDFYMFRSYESGRSSYLVLIANYLPVSALEDAAMYQLDPNARYDIHITNDGDPIEDITFRFQFSLTTQFRNLSVGVPGGTVTIDAPVVALQRPQPPGDALLNIPQATANVTMIRGPLSSPTSAADVINRNNGTPDIPVAPPFIGTKTFANYAQLAQGYIAGIDIPGCETSGRIFIGPRRDSVAGNPGALFDLVNLPSLTGSPDTRPGSFQNATVTSLALEIPVGCLTNASNVLGAWTTSSVPSSRALPIGTTFTDPQTVSGDFVQVSRLANPLVNELLVGLPDKDRFNGTRPVSDEAYLDYITNPTLPELIETLFGNPAPNNFPREDLVQFYLSGIPGVNSPAPALATPADLLRINTAAPPTPRGQQKRLGVLAGDTSGFPNGRRPGDDVVDITLRVLEGALCRQQIGADQPCTPDDAPGGALPVTDGIYIDDYQFDPTFPFLRTPPPANGTLPDTLRQFAAGLSGGSVVPPTGTIATGNCLGTLSGSLLSMDCTHDAGDEVEGTIRNAKTGQNGDVICTNSTGPNPMTFRCTLNKQQTTEVLLNRMYILIQTPQFPDGEIRGQILLK